MTALDEWALTSSSTALAPGTRRLVLLAAADPSGDPSLVRPVSAAPDLDGWAITEWLLTDLVSLEEQIWLVIDDLHELGSAEMRQLELLLMRGPPHLRSTLATRHDLRPGLHRLRLEGELTETAVADQHAGVGLWSARRCHDEGFGWP
jgi:LuxR family transcriptional regulator, maltose regulon positive regulatory protein